MTDQGPAVNQHGNVDLQIVQSAFAVLSGSVLLVYCRPTLGMMFPFKSEVVQPIWSLFHRPFTHLLMTL